MVWQKEQRPKVLQASTSEVYGDPEVHPQHEGYWGNVNTLGPRACYDEGKRCAETLFMNYHQQNNVRIKIARIFNTYGPKMNSNDGRVVSNFIVQALKGEDITIYGDGSHTRSFQYVDDLIDGLIKLMNTPDSFTGPVNLGNPVEFTIGSLAEYGNKNDGIEIEDRLSVHCHRMIPNNVSRIYHLQRKWSSGLVAEGLRLRTLRKDPGEDNKDNFGRESRSE